eukprot:4732168-Prymnesium_polylepis.1
MARNAVPTAKPNERALKTDAEDSTKPVVSPPAPFRKPYDDVLRINAPDADDPLTCHISCRLGSLEETMFHCFAGFNNSVETRPYVTAFAATSSVGLARDVMEIAQGDAQHVKQVPIRPRQCDDQTAAPRKVLKKVLVPSGFKERRRLSEASLDREMMEMKTNLSGMQLWLFRTVGAVIAALLVVGLVAFCSRFAASTVPPTVCKIDMIISLANRNIDL